MTDLQAEVSRRAGELEVVGVAVGILRGGEEQYAFHGITSIENPLPLDENTLFQFGSTGKTYTATAMMRLVDEGKVDLHEKVRTYISEFKLRDESVASEVTVLHLFNHTAGWAGDVLDNTGDGDDALARYVELLSTVEQVTPLGKVASYNNASLSVAGRIIEKVTGKTYEQAIKELLLEPLGMDHTFFFPNEVMTRRFVVGHQRKDDGRTTVARPWALPRGGTPAGGMASNAGDLIKWARFHLGDGSGVLSKATLDLMKEPTFEFAGSDLGDYVGISWFLRDVDGVRIVEHGGNTVGQNCAFQMIPERDFAVVVLTNSQPNGGELEQQLVKWAFEEYAGVVLRDPEPVKLDEAKLVEYAGEYTTIAVTAQIEPANGGLLIKPAVKPEEWAKISEDEIPDQPPIPVGILPGEGDRYIVTEGDAKGMKGYFSRNDEGVIDGVHVGGRLMTRVGGKR